MLYYLFRYLDTAFDFPGAGLFNYISFRAAITLITSLFLSMIVGKRIIKLLQKKQIGEEIRALGLAGQESKKGTPTMGGIIILIAIIVPCLLFGRLGNIYLQLMLFTTIWLGALGFCDDYIKVFKKNKEGIPGKAKLAGQIVLGLIVGCTLFYHPSAVVVEQVTDNNRQVLEQIESDPVSTNIVVKSIKSTQTTIPFYSGHNLDYADLFTFAGQHAETLAWIFFILLTVFIVMATSNGANLTDGLDGLAAGTSSIIGVAMAFLAYVSSHVFFSDYLDIMFIPHSQELVVYAAAFIGATVGFLWYNTYPAQVFMGDTGSLALGGIIGVFAILIHKELLLPFLCGIFLMENLSVIIQTTYFKHTKRKYGEGRRVFLMAPLHHHFQKKGIHEVKIVTRFWIIGIALAIFTILTLKIR